MEVALQRLPRAVAKVTVTIAPEDVKQEMDRAFRSVVGRYNIPGFRRGKVPRPIFERYVGRGVLLQEAAEKIVEKRYADALKQAEIDAIGEPRINIVSLEDGEPFQFDIEVESKPQIDLGDYQDLLKTPLGTRQIEESEVAEELQKLAKGQAQLVPVDEGEVAMGDHVVASLKGFLDDEESQDEEPFVDEEEYAVEVGSGTMVEGLETQLVGLAVGQPVTLRLAYPAEHPDVSLAGKNVRFDVTIQEIKRPDMPSINDDLAKTLGYESEKDLREHVANSLEHRIADQLKQERVTEILGKLKERVTFDLPEVMVDRVIHSQLGELENTLQRMGADVEEYLASRQISGEALHEEFRPQAEERVKDELLMEAVALDQGLTVSDDEVMESLRPLAEAYKQPVSAIASLFRQRGEFEGIRHSLLLGKASDYLATTVVE